MASSKILHAPPGKPGRRIMYGDDPNQFGELTLPESPGPHPAVIFIHGGYWRAAYDLAHARHFCVAIAKAGCAVWSLEYRRVGQPGGGYPGTLDDIRAGALAIAGFPEVDLDRVVLAGHSAGGQLALWLAAQEVLSVKGVVGLAAVSDLRYGYSLRLSNGAIPTFLGGTPDEMEERYAASSPIDLLPLRVPQVILHGVEDEVVPIELSRRFVEKSCNARLVELPGVGHYEVIDPLNSACAEVLATLLKIATG